MKSKGIKITSSLVTVALMSSLLTAAKPYDVQKNNEKIIKSLEETLLKESNRKVNSRETVADKDKLPDKENLPLENNPEEVVRIIVEMKEQPAAIKAGDARNATQSMIKSTIDSQANVRKTVESLTNKTVKNTYGNLINGFSIDAKRKDIDSIKKLPGVKSVSEANTYKPTMATAKDLTQVKDVWENKKYKGEGLVAAIIDTGIDYTHKDMKDPSNKEKMKIKDGDKKTYDEGQYFTDKVPYGFNFADNNNEVKDLTGSMHGMHVAGIVAANGSEEEVNAGKAIQGVAPEAQLLAMKVFPNNPNFGSAFSDDIIAAIEKSVELGADVINMSLGSDCGFVDDDDPEQKVIKEAADAGVICVISAGNSSYSSDPYILEDSRDLGTVGTPGTATDAIEVASSENSMVTLNAFTAIVNGKAINMGYTQCDVDPFDKLSGSNDLTFVDCGTGIPSDFEGKDLSGKIALIQRGEIAFVDKQLNAQAAGAKAVIVYNNGNDGYLNMASDPSMTIPAMFISKEDGEKLKNNIENASAKFNGATVSSPNVAGGNVSDFTSWGPTPNLDFAPEVTAPGGNIFSTLNNNKYGSMSGTSMAAPHTTGVTALIIQSLKDKGLDLKEREILSYVKNCMINTSKVLYDGKIPYSPRRQGAGLVQAEDAIDNNVLATGKDGQATISLKEIGDKTEFDITLTNYSDKDESYTVESQCVLTSVVPEIISVSQMSSDEVIEGATVTFDKKDITVPANGKVNVKATLSVPADKAVGNYAEGYINFKNKGNSPSLVVPYMGFHGDWSKERIVSPMIWDKDSNNYLIPSIVASESVAEGAIVYNGFVGVDDQNQVKIESDKIAISPNNDGEIDTIIPALYMLRNAKTATIDLLDKNKNVIGDDIQGTLDLRKKVLSAEGGDVQQLFEDLEWDGTLYNPKTGDSELVEEGQYYIRIQSKVDMENAKEQDVIVPVKVDITAPSINLVSDSFSGETSYKLDVTIDDSLSKVNLAKAIVNGTLVDLVDQKNGHYTADVNLLPDYDNEISVAAIDFASNVGSSTYKISTKKDSKPVVNIDNIVPGYQVNSKDLVVTGSVNSLVSELTIGGVKADISKGTFSVPLTLNEGANYVSVIAKDINGVKCFDYSIKVYCDVTAPKIVLENVADENGVISIADNSLTLKGAVSDNSFGYIFYINGKVKEEIYYEGELKDEGFEELTRREFNEELTVNDGDIVSLKAVDMFGNETIKKYTVSICPILGIKSITNGGSPLVDGTLTNKDVLPELEYDKNLYDVSMTLNGEEYKEGTAISNDGKYSLVVNANLKETVDKAAILGAKADIDPKKTVVINFEIDKVAPLVNITGVEEGKSYNKDVVPVIEVEEGSSVLELTVDGVDYDNKAVSEEGSHKIVIKVSDKAGNITTKEINFIVDKTAPSITIEGVESLKTYENGITPIVKVDEENAEVTITLNDKEYDGSVIDKDGNYVLKVVAIDLAGNKSESSLYFTVKTKQEDTKPDDGDTKPLPGENDGKDDENDSENPSVDDDDSSVDNGSNNTTTKPDATQKPSSNTIPKTGAIIGTTVLMIIGLGCVVLGCVFVIRKRKNAK